MSVQSELKAPILLLQSRHPDDIMLNHEMECIREHLGPGITLHSHNAINSPFPPNQLSHFAGVVFGGSGDCSVIDPHNQPWVTPLLRVLERTLEENIPGLGLCFGHQLLAKALGATVATDPKREESGTIDLDLTPAGKQDPLFKPLPSPFPAHTGHSDSVMDVPTGVTLLATSRRLSTQAFRVDDAPFFSTQFHPDLTGLQAQERYRAYQELLPRGDRKPNEELFTPRADQATGILRRFGQWVLREQNHLPPSPPVA